MVYPKPTVAQRREVALRARGLCEYCCIPVKYSVQSFECEHILPIALGGDNSLNNLAFSCGGCNRCKSIRIMGIDVDSGLEAPLFNPRQQNWADHFVWDEDFTHVLGLTATGRATVNALRMNRAGLVNLRQILLLAGEHPPL